MTKIIFGINVPYQSSEIDWDATDARDKKLREEGKPIPYFNYIRVPVIRIHKELSFELCDICGTQIVAGRRSRRLTTCCPAHNAKKWDAVNGLIIQRERNMVGERPTHFWQTISYECFKRDNFTCQKCNKNVNQLNMDREAERNNKDWSYLDYSLHCHHIKPIKDGGSNKLENLLTECGKCHKKEEAHKKQKKGQTKFSLEEF